MQTYLFCEIAVDISRRTVSVYDDPSTEVDIHTQLYTIPDHQPISESDTKIKDKNIAHLVVHILKNFPFSGGEKTLGGLCQKVIEKMQIYENERDTSEPPVSEFYEKMHVQQYMDGIHHTYKYENVMSMDDIITRAYELQIINKKTLLKYLLSDDDIYSYKLENCKVIDVMIK